MIINLNLLSSEKKRVFINIFLKILIIVDIPVQICRCVKEKDLKKNLAVSNGFSNDIIDKMMKKKMFKLSVKDVSIIRNEKCVTIIVSVSYHRYIREKIYKDQRKMVKFKSNQN